jgi:hypothetical protein
LLNHVFDFANSPARIAQIVRKSGPTFWSRRSALAAL